MQTQGRHGRDFQPGQTQAQTQTRSHIVGSLDIILCFLNIFFALVVWWLSPTLRHSLAADWVRGTSQAINPELSFDTWICCALKQTPEPGPDGGPQKTPPPKVRRHFYYDLGSELSAGWPAADDDIRLGTGLEADADLGSLPRALAGEGLVCVSTSNGLCYFHFHSHICIRSQLRRAENWSKPEAAHHNPCGFNLAGLLWSWGWEPQLPIVPNMQLAIRKIIRWSTRLIKSPANRWLSRETETQSYHKRSREVGKEGYTGKKTLR